MKGDMVDGVCEAICQADEASMTDSLCEDMPRLTKNSTADSLYTDISGQSSGESL